jgi:regulator of cell morphogenesis and NO signaling
MSVRYDQSHSGFFRLSLVLDFTNQSTAMYETINYNTISVAEVAIQHPGAVNVFNKYNIDFCCGGKRPFREVCEQAGLDPEEIMGELTRAESGSMPGTIRFDTWDVSLLLEFIIQHHHSYVQRSVPQLTELLDKVLSVHGDTRPELASLKETFDELADELLQHMEKEEIILFPAIQRLHSETRIPVEATPIPANLSAPMRVMEDEHTHAGNLIKIIRSITNTYTPPETACPTFRVTYRRLQEFDQDLMQHIHLENNVLFTKVRNRLNETML